MLTSKEKYRSNTIFVLHDISFTHICFAFRAMNEKKDVRKSAHKFLNYDPSHLGTVLTQTNRETRVFINFFQHEHRVYHAREDCKDQNYP